jgi:hypothetical protein
MVDKNGLISYSKIILADKPCAVKNKLAVYPNPLNSQKDISITYENYDTSTMATIVLIDFAGKELLNKKVAIHTGINQLSISSVSLSNGVYSVRLIAGNNRETKKFVINR